MSRSSFALYFHGEAYTLKGKVMGRQSAGTALMKAIAAEKPGQFWCYAGSQQAATECANTLAEHGSPRTGVSWIPYSAPQRLAEPGLLYRPDPILHGEAWRRLDLAGSRAYSLCGITHTTASHGVMEGLAGLLTAPLESWDAIICTSRAVRDSVRVVVESQRAYLAERLGATQFTLPQMPVIPLGVHCEELARARKGRGAARRALGIAADEVVVLFVGRLSFHGKAHPVPMYLGLEACAPGRKIVLLQAGWYANEAIEKAFVADAAALCPSVRMLHVDARDQARLAQAWGAADIFTSLSDNIQETFGLTPIEAMAAGLPAVVSDWDGYKDTVRDGIDGFRIPTLSLPPGAGRELADRFDLGADSYDHYCGYASQLVAVSVEATAAAFRKLIADPDLRARMGAAAQQRAREVFDWSLIMRRYHALWEELHERRRADAQLRPPLTRRRRPDRPDPFAMFASYPSRILTGDAVFSRAPGATADMALARRDLATTRFAGLVMPSPDLVARLLDLIPEEGGLTADQISKRLNVAPLLVFGALVWLSKVGVLAFHDRAPIR